MRLDGRADPIDGVRWVAAETLSANLYNPNVVMEAEFRLLERSLLITGWVQPLLVTPAWTIIDGFHRWDLSCKSPAVRAVYGGQVPVAVLSIPEADAILLTVRINRAKGSHVALRMSELVRSLIDDHGCSRERVQAELGASRDEVDLLYKGGVFKVKDSKAHTYSKSWRPIESATRPVNAVPADGPETTEDDR